MSSSKTGDQYGKSFPQRLQLNDVSHEHNVKPLFTTTESQSSPFPQIKISISLQMIRDSMSSMSPQSDDWSQYVFELIE